MKNKMNIKDPRASRSRQALLDAGIQAFLQNPNASLTEVATFAGVGRATLYRHFETREQLIQEMAKESLIQIDKAMAPIYEKNLKGSFAIKAMFEVSMPVADRFHFLLSLWNIANEDTKVREIYDRQLNEINTLVEQGKRAGEIKSDMTTTWIVTLIDCLIYAGWWSIKDGHLDAKSASELAIASLFGGIQT
ncbi:TetR/AcrR family transcriptional regulator [Pseudoalteromonas denitrificans]|uniref:Transcriptional regulator, TetR family n=1 Tax=Pseudoalteromonas denitrificans DSM 6059 TaxID=1123010 RepID=A0A1I1KID7_9GAMM|nr:TetR/AcrR family transcriptional regulator [Pseudoalteromonas denitrificans]SFC58438.1 transcriptional regulator, TetR family [Pseudoalteromonas denitrificans DSM 6059]